MSHVALHLPPWGVLEHKPGGQLALEGGGREAASIAEQAAQGKERSRRKPLEEGSEWGNGGQNPPTKAAMNFGSM